MKRFKVGLLYSAKANAPHESADEDTPWDRWNELDSEQSISGYERALREGGHEVIPLEGMPRLPQKLERYPVDICFNTCEGHRGKSREAQVPALLDMLGIPYTGSGVMSLAIALDKAMTKRVLQFYSIPTAHVPDLHHRRRAARSAAQLSAFCQSRRSKARASGL